MQLFYENGLRARIKQNELNQFELMRLFTGTWKKVNPTISNTYIGDTSFRNRGLFIYTKVTPKGKIGNEMKWIWANGKKSNNYLVLNLFQNNQDDVLHSSWHTLKDTFESMSYLKEIESDMIDFICSLFEITCYNKELVKALMISYNINERSAISSLYEPRFQ